MNVFNADNINKNELSVIKNRLSSFELKVLLVLWMVFSLPSIVYGEWFPMDMEAIFAIGQNLQERMLWIISPYNGSGRYFPFYWLYNCFQFKLFGTNIEPYFFVQSVIFALSVLLTANICKKVTQNTFVTILLIIAIYFSTPVAENINTIGKPEPIAFFLVIAAIFIFSRKHIYSEPISLIDYIIITLLFLLAFRIKETSIAVLGFSLSGIIFIAVVAKFKKIEKFSLIFKDYICLSLFLLVGILASIIPYFIFSPNSEEGGYLKYEITAKLIGDNLIFYIEQQPDVLVFAVLTIVFLTIVGLKLFSTDKLLTQFNMRVFNLIVSLSTMALAYYLVLLIWRWPMAYYMLLPAIIFKLAAFYGIYQAWMFGLIGRSKLRFLYCVIGGCFIYSTFYIYYITLSQITYSRIYREAIEKYVSLNDFNHRLILESYPFYAEQVRATAQLVLVDKGIKIHVDGIADVLDPAVSSNKEILKLLKVTKSQLDQNYFNIPRKGDYLLVITGNKLATWFLRGVTPYYREDSILKKQGVYDMKLISEAQSYVPALYFHVWDKVLASGETYIGYKIYQVTEDIPKYFWRGRYPDGWIGKKANLIVNANYKNAVVVNVSTPNFILPNKVVIKKNGAFYKEIQFINTDKVEVFLSDQVKEPVDFKFEVEKAIIPKEIKINKDTRELALRVDIK